MADEEVEVYHHVNGATRVTRLHAPRISRQMADGGVHIVLQADDRTVLGDAMFTAGGIVAVSGAAIAQYRRQPAAVEVDTKPPVVDITPDPLLSRRSP